MHRVSYGMGDSLSAFICGLEQLVEAAQDVLDHHANLPSFGEDGIGANMCGPVESIHYFDQGRCELAHIYAESVADEIVRQPGFFTM